MVIFEHFQDTGKREGLQTIKKLFELCSEIFFMSVTYKKQQSVQLCINENRIKTQQPVQIRRD